MTAAGWIDADLSDQDAAAVLREWIVMLGWTLGDRGVRERLADNLSRAVMAEVVRPLRAEVAAKHERILEVSRRALAVEAERDGLRAEQRKVASEALREAAQVFPAWMSKEVARTAVQAWLRARADVLADDAAGDDRG